MLDVDMKVVPITRDVRSRLEITRGSAHYVTSIGPQHSGTAVTAPEHGNRNDTGGDLDDLIRTNAEHSISSDNPVQHGDLTDTAVEHDDPADSTVETDGLNNAKWRALRAAFNRSLGRLIQWPREMLKELRNPRSQASPGHSVSGPQLRGGGGEDPIDLLGHTDAGGVEPPASRLRSRVSPAATSSITATASFSNVGRRGEGQSTSKATPEVSIRASSPIPDETRPARTPQKVSHSESQLCPNTDAKGAHRLNKSVMAAARSLAPKSSSDLIAILDQENKRLEEESLGIVEQSASDAPTVRRSASFPQYPVNSRGRCHKCWMPYIGLGEVCGCYDQGKPDDAALPAQEEQLREGTEVDRRRELLARLASRYSCTQ
jgi:hypothetical protein